MQNYIYIERAEACLRRVLYICNSIVRSTTTSRQARWALRIDHIVGIAIHHKAVRRGGHCKLTTWWALRIKIILEEHPRET